MSYVAAVHLTRSNLSRQSGDLAAARSEAERSLQLARDCGDPWSEELALAALATFDSGQHGTKAS